MTWGSMGGYCVGGGSETAVARTPRHTAKFLRIAYLLGWKVASLSQREQHELFTKKAPSSGKWLSASFPYQEGTLVRGLLLFSVPPRREGYEFAVTGARRVVYQEGSFARKVAYRLFNRTCTT